MEAATVVAKSAGVNPKGPAGLFFTGSAQRLILIKAAGENQGKNLAWQDQLNMESTMEKRSIVGAVQAESLVFESGFGFAEALGSGSSHEVTGRAPPVAEGSLMPGLKSVKLDRTTKPPVSH